MELILTQAEKDAARWADLDNESLGKLLRATLTSLRNSSEELNVVLWQSASLLLCTEFPEGKTISLRGVSVGGVVLGDYTVIIEKT